MTRREEAIAYFKRHLDLYCVDGISRESEEMAIKALEQEPCEDIISRAEAFEALNSLNGTSELDKAFEVIEKLPSVTPKGVTITDFADKCRECGREKVLDKIRAEIDEEYRNESEHPYGQGLRRAIEIIDKYKTESEVLE